MHAERLNNSVNIMIDSSILQNYMRDAKSGQKTELRNDKMTKGKREGMTKERMTEIQSDKEGIEMNPIMN